MRHIKWWAIIFVLMFSFGVIQNDTLGLTIEPMKPEDYQKFCYKFTSSKDKPIYTEATIDQKYILGCEYRFYKRTREREQPITINLDDLKYRKHPRYEEIRIRVEKNVQAETDEPVLFKHRGEDWITLGSGTGDSELDLYEDAFRRDIMVYPPQTVFSLSATDEPEGEDRITFRFDEGAIFTGPDEDRPYRDPSHETIPADQLEGAQDVSESRPPDCPPCPQASRLCPPTRCPPNPMYAPPLREFFSDFSCRDAERTKGKLLRIIRDVDDPNSPGNTLEVLHRSYLNDILTQLEEMMGILCYIEEEFY